MERLAFVTGRTMELAKRVFAESTHEAICEWLESHGWRWLGGRWASLGFQNFCCTFSMRKAVELEIFRQLLVAHKIQGPTAMDWLVLRGGTK